MKMIGWALFGLSVLLFLFGVVSKFMGMGGGIMGVPPLGWWRAAMALAIYCVAWALLHGNGSRHSH
jgi:hypothetical protein